MENEFGNDNPSNIENAQTDYEGLDANALKNALVEKDTKLTEYNSLNRQLFERAKKAEGFTKQSDGSWVKIEKEPAKKEKPSDKKTEDSALMERIDTLALKSEGIKDDDEIELAHKIKAETGKDMDEVLSLKYFKAELEALREDKANRQASSNVPSGGTTGSAKNTSAYWDAKGTLPTREDVPDRATRMKIVHEMMGSSKGSKKFYND